MGMKALSPTAAALMPPAPPARAALLMFLAPESCSPARSMPPARPAAVRSWWAATIRARIPRCRTPRPFLLLIPQSLKPMPLSLAMAARLSSGRIIPRVTTVLSRRRALVVGRAVLSKPPASSSWMWRGSISPLWAAPGCLTRIILPLVQGRQRTLPGRLLARLPGPRRPIVLWSITLRSMPFWMQEPM